MVALVWASTRLWECLVGVVAHRRCGMKGLGFSPWWCMGWGMHVGRRWVAGGVGGGIRPPPGWLFQLMHNI